MVDLTKDELERFMSKSDFDFSTEAGWREFLNERSTVWGGKGRDADGIHMRDLKNYSVGAATIITTGQPVPVILTVRTQGSPCRPALSTSSILTQRGITRLRR